MATNEKSNLRNPPAFFLGLIYVSFAMTLLFFSSYVYLVVDNTSYQEALCNLIVGRITPEPCPIEPYKDVIPWCVSGCWIICYDLFIRWSAVPGIEVEVFLGRFSNYSKTTEVFLTEINKPAFRCFYRDGGKEIILKLSNPIIFLIICLSLLVIGIISLLIYLIGFGGWKRWRKQSTYREMIDNESIKDENL